MARSAVLEGEASLVGGRITNAVVVPDVAAARTAIRAREVECLVVLDLSSLGPNVTAIANSVEVLLGMGAPIEVTESGVTRGTPDGEPIRAQLAWAADLQRRASRAPVACDGRTGSRGGRHPKPVDEARLCALWRDGASQVAMAESLGVSRGTVQRRLAALRLKGRPGPLTTGDLRADS